MKIIVEFRKEADGRWTASVARWKLSITRDTLDQVRWNVWEWIVGQMKIGMLGKIEKELEEDLASMRTLGRLEDPWVGVSVQGVGKYIEADSAYDAIQWTGGNLPEVIRLVSMAPGHTVIPMVGGRWIVIESAGGRSAVDTTDWIIRRPDGTIKLRKDVDFKVLCVPLPEIINITQPEENQR